MNREITQLIVHCSATNRHMDFGAERIDRWHRAQGWWGIGYHWVIRRDGTLEQGRPERKKGAHCKGSNANSIGICLIGGVDEQMKPEDNFTDTQMRTLAELLTDKQCQYPGAKVYGHRDMPGVKKACPSFDVVAWYSNIGNPE